MHFKLDIDLDRYRHFVLLAVWCLIMWLGARYLGVQGFEIKTTYGTLLWLAVTYVGVALILYFARPRA